MQIKFIAQGLDSDTDITAGDVLIESLESQNFTIFNAFVAFVGRGGVRNMIDAMLRFKENGGSIRLFLGVDLNATSKEALDYLLENNIESYIVYSPNNLIYHPKVYTFEGENVTRALVGSSNFTTSGLFQNVEASVCIDFTNEEESGSAFLADIYDYFNGIINLAHPSCQLLTQEILDILIENKVVLPEVVSRMKTNQINQDFGQKETKNNTRLLNLFGKIKPKRPPKGYKKTLVNQKMIEVGEENINIIAENITLTDGSMWIETGKMTGGSRNILDLSKKGKLNGVTKFGSVSYFGINPEDVNDTKDIDIEFGGKNYKGNHIFYAEGNSNWRIQIKGVTDNDEKITAFSKPTLGMNGGFQDKILVFTKIDDVNFRLEILEKDELDKLIENSSDWAKGGNESIGRAYGIVNLQ
jgi:HKD family nuclease